MQRICTYSAETPIRILLHLVRRDIQERSPRRVAFMRLYSGAVLCSALECNCRGYIHTSVSLLSCIHCV